MPLFNAPNTDRHLYLLLRRMLKLHQLVIEGKITAADLESISKLSVAALQAKADALMSGTLDATDPANQALISLFEGLSMALPNENILAESVVEGLKEFEVKHGDYLPLTPLAVENKQTLALSLNDFASFYAVFIKHIAVEQKEGELGYEYNLKFDQLEAKKTWLQWQQTRPSHLNLSPDRIAEAGLFEKFIAGRLKKDEWLTDVDIQRALTLFELKGASPHVTRFNKDDLGFILHFEREKHEQDDPKQPYTIPLIVNLGEDGHSRIDSRGMHWTRLLITVDPTNQPPQITVDYKDELTLSDADKKKISETLLDALKYNVQFGGYTGTEPLKIYRAFPECENPVINVTGSQEQRDGFSCGYRAIKGLIADLIDKQVIQLNDTYQHLLATQDSSSLRDVIYRTLLGRQPISSEARAHLEHIADDNLVSSLNQFMINPELIEGQLLAFSDSPALSNTRKAGQFNSEELKKLVVLNKQAEKIRQLPIIQAITSTTGDVLTVNFEEIFNHPELVNEDKSFVARVIFEAINKNKAINTLNLLGTHSLDQKALQQHLDVLPINLKMTSDNPYVEEYYSLLKARNDLLVQQAFKKAKPGQGPWDQFFEFILFDLPISATQIFNWASYFSSGESPDLQVSVFTKMLQYMADNENLFINTNFPYQQFRQGNQVSDVAAWPNNLDMLNALAKHLQSDTPFVAFNQFNFTIPDLKNKELQNEFFNTIHTILTTPQAQAITQFSFTAASAESLDEESLNRLIDFIKTNHIKTLISFNFTDKVKNPALARKLAELENASLTNRRNPSLPPQNITGASIAKQEKITLGQIGKALLNTGSLGDLDTDSQVQQQQQQQVQQQVQTAPDDDNLPEEDELKEETYQLFADQDELLDKAAFIGLLGKFVNVRHPHLTAEQAWDLITGENSHLFKHGIRKITQSAAKLLIDNLQDVQYGLHPDNLPRGFSLQQDNAGNVILAYDAANAPININESPLTLKFSKPRQRNQWAGNALQFISLEQAQELYDAVIKKMGQPRPSLETCIQENFSLNVVGKRFTIEQQRLILDKFIEGTAKERAEPIKQQLTQVFGKHLTKRNIAALSEILYEQGPEELAKLLDSFAQLKQVKGDKFFASFKTCFIDSSDNLNELTTGASQDAIQKLLTLSTAQTAWWQSLTEQHTSHLKYYPAQATGEDADFAVVAVNTPGQRWANLAELTDGFTYFCSQLEELRPDLNLTQFCPLTNVADMRVGLDRLISTILPKASNINEQFYEGLHHLLLDPLGPFYAVRYEGFKLVHEAMLLHLGVISQSPKNDKRFADQDFCFREDKSKISGNLADTQADKDDNRKAIFLRYIATFNHRASLKNYLYAYEQIVDKCKHSADPTRIASLLILVAVFGTGKRGKHFNQENIDVLLSWMEQNEQAGEMNPALYNIFASWRELRYYPIKPTLGEIITISKLALATEQPVALIKDFTTIIKRFNKDQDAAEAYINIALLSDKNKQSIEFILIQDIIYQLEGLNDPQLQKLEDTKAESNLPSNLRMAAYRLLAVCNNEGITPANGLDKARALLTQVEACFDKHGAQTTSDILELLGHIDVTSGTLPQLDHLTAIVQSITNNPKPDYVSLEQAVKAQLPQGCTIQMNQVAAAPVEATGNLQTTISKYMAEIKQELSGERKQINQYFGSNFYENLDTPAGAKALMDGLKQLSSLTGWINQFVIIRVRNVMNTVYDAVINDGIARLGIRDENTRNQLTKIIQLKFNHKIRKAAEFNEFANLYASEITALEQILASLQFLQKKRPSEFAGVIAILDKDNLSTYPLSLIAAMMESLIKMDENKPFPSVLFNQLLSFKDPVQINTLHEIISTIFDDDSPLSDEEKLLIGQLSAHVCQEDAGIAQRFTHELIGLHDKGFFVEKLHLLTQLDHPSRQLTAVNDAFNQLHALNQPDLTKITLEFFTDKQRDFIPFMDGLNAVEENKKAIILNIVMKAAQKQVKENSENYTQETLLNTVNTLTTKDINELGRLNELYNTPRFPGLNELNELLKQPINLKELQEKYDLDPTGKRQDPAELAKQYDLSQLTSYINALKDLNYDRPLLLSQRQQLRTWFLLVNSIGKDKPILTNPADPENSPAKAFKDMSHREIQNLFNYYRTQLAKDISAEQRTDIKLQAIALLREAMYRGSGYVPRATQVLYLLTAMQSGHDYVAQVQTGEGKSMIAAMAAAMASLEGKTVDVCTSNLFLAQEGVDENRNFFDYLGIPVKLIHANSNKDDYQEGAIHYSSMSEVALYRSKMQLVGKDFPKDCALIADEVDFSTLDDSTRYRYATSLDQATDPYKSPYTWVYEALINFADTQNTPMTDEQFREQAKAWLKNSAKTKEQRVQLQKLEAQPDVYNKRLTTWLIAAGKTGQLIKEEETRFRVIALEHKKDGRVSKACLLSGGRPNVQAEFSNSIQQFLHVRLREKYKAEIEKGEMPDFLVEPEKTYVTTLNSKILMSTYTQRMGMSGTVGSPEEIKEQYAKYGFRFVDIPPFMTSNRDDLAPILTNPKLINNPNQEEDDHIKQIVKDILKHIEATSKVGATGQCSPVLIHCADKIQGEKISKALKSALAANPGKYANKYSGLQSFYSSEKPTAEQRNQEEKEYKSRAKQDGMITISTVFDRGTDIDPTHPRGLYSVKTYVDTKRYSDEDLERSKRQAIGRAARKGKVGYTRLIVRRSEFSEVYTLKQMRNIRETNESLDKAIADLNHLRNQERTAKRELRESFDDIKHVLYQEFLKYIEVINTSDEKVAKKEIRDKVLMQWNLILNEIDTAWEALQEDTRLSERERLQRLAGVACNTWNKLSAANGLLREEITHWASHKGIAVSLPAENPLNAETIVSEVSRRYPGLQVHYVKDTQLYTQLDERFSPDAVYCDFITRQGTNLQNETLQQTVTQTRQSVMQGYLADYRAMLATPAYKRQLDGKFTIQSENPETQQIEEIMGALLYLRYKAYQQGNLQGYARLSGECRLFAKQMIWSGQTDSIAKAQQKHFSALTNHRGDHEIEKGQYLNIIMAEWRQSLPKQTAAWKQDSFKRWWGGDANDRSSSMQHQVLQLLSNYKDDWWTRGWVSGDRKQVVTHLMNELSHPDLKTGLQILEKIAVARKQLLEDDFKHNRSMASGVNGRLFKYLNEIETRVKAAMTPTEIDAAINQEFTDIADTLSRFAECLEAKEQFDSVIATIQNERYPVDYKYRTISAFFKDISLWPSHDPRLIDENWEVLQQYCKNKQSEFVYYFAQSNQYAELNQRRSVQVYQAIMNAAAGIFYHLTGKTSSKSHLPDNSFDYNGQTIEFENNFNHLRAVENSRIFNRINHTETYHELLTALEKSIVNHSPDNTIVKFKKITLKEGQLPANGEMSEFILKIDMEIDGKPASIDYHIDLKTGAMYTDNQQFADMDLEIDERREELSSIIDLSGKTLTLSKDLRSDINESLGDIHSNGAKTRGYRGSMQALREDDETSSHANSYKTI